MKRFALGLLCAVVPLAAGASDETPGFNLQRAGRSIGYLDFLVEHPQTGVESESFCNTVLVGENLALTNFHCVSNQAVCDNTLAVFTAEDGRTVEGVYQCTRFIGGVEPGERDGDYTLIELDDLPGLHHGWIQIARTDQHEYFDAMENGLDIWRVKYDPATIIRPQPSLSYVRCYGALDPEFTDFIRMPFIHPEEDTEPCHTMAGNSGGALLSERGDLIGLVSQVWFGDEETRDENNIVLNDLKGAEIRGPAVHPIVERFPQLHEQPRTPGPHYFTTVDWMDGLE